MRAILRQLGGHAVALVTRKASSAFFILPSHHIDGDLYGFLQVGPTVTARGAFISPHVGYRYASPPRAHAEADRRAVRRHVDIAQVHIGERFRDDRCYAKYLCTPHYDSNILSLHLSNIFLNNCLTVCRFFFLKNTADTQQFFSLSIVRQIVYNSSRTLADPEQRRKSNI